MTRWLWPATAAFVLLVPACDGGASSPSPEPSEAAASVLHAYDVHLDPDAEPGSDEITFIVHASTFPLHVTVTGPDVDICPVPPPEGETPPCRHSKAADIRAEGVIVRATDEAVDIDEIAIRYAPSDHTARIELPTLPPRPGESACKDGCNPVFELTPFRQGLFSATATWEGIGTGALIAETGGMSEHAYSELGKPYKVIVDNAASSDQGEPQLAVTGRFPEEEAGFALENRGARPLLEPALEITWPS